MTERARDLAKRGTGGVTGGSGQVSRLAGLVAPRSSLVHRVVPAHLACRIAARAQAAERPLDHPPCSATPEQPSALSQQAPLTWPANGARNRPAAARRER
jgi:hypothetical protein